MSLSHPHRARLGAVVLPAAALAVVGALAAGPVSADLVVPRPATFDHRALDAITQKAVKGRYVDYDVVEKARPALQAYLKRVAAASVEGMTKPERLAFYTNAYNALVLEQVLVHKRPKSVLDVKGFFDAQKHTVAGEAMTLNDLEGKKLRSEGDPRVHFVVNCASDDCPPLAARAYTGADWEKQLEAQTKAYLTRSGEIAVDDEKKTIQVVQLFEWYLADWGGEDGARKFLGRYRRDLKKKLDDKSYRLTYRPYDWDLNRTR